MSQQTRRRQRLNVWKQQVRQEAETAWSDDSPPLTGLLGLQVIYFYQDHELDIDNFIKPIQDALIGVVYENDIQIIDLAIYKRPLDQELRLINPSSALEKGLSKKTEFLYISTRETSNQEVLELWIV